MYKLAASALLLLFLTGCASPLPVYIPTGNPVTDVLVSAAVEEGARFVASKVVPVVLSTALDDGGVAYSAMTASISSSGSLLPQSEKRVPGYGGVVYVGDWD